MNKLLLEEKLREINKIILTKYKDEQELGVLVGLSGLSLFQFYYSKYSDINKYAETGTEIITRCIDKIHKGYNYPTYCTGLAGFGRTLDHLVNVGFVDAKSDELLAQFDHYLYTIMVSNMKNGNFDFLHGGIGYAFYFLERYESTKSVKLKEKYKSILLEFTELITELSESGGGKKLRWLSVVSETKKEIYNLSLSHGIASVIGILVKLYKHDDFKSETETVLKGAISYVLSFMNEDIDAFSLFPSWIAKRGEYDYQSRLAWCYGDLGIALQFWHASKVLQDLELGNIALGILRHAAKRTTPEKTLVIDASICHGSFGNALVFLRMFKESKDSTFWEAAEFWIQEGLNMAVHKGGYAGYKQWKGEADVKWNPETSLLEGIAGIGLVIMDYLAEYDTTWDECLMLS